MILRSKLLRLIYQFYPAGVPIDHPEYTKSEEYRRRMEAQQVAVQEKKKWTEMLQRIGAVDASFHILAGGWPDSALSAFVELPRCALGFHLSVLGPYYGVHRIGTADEAPVADAIALEIEKTYGYEIIPPEVGYGRVRHVELNVRQMHEATIYACLLSPSWDHSSHDDDDPVPENLRDTKVLRPPNVIMTTGMTKASRQALIERLMALDLPDE
jgi:hypothetical protein